MPQNTHLEIIGAEAQWATELRETTSLETLSEKAKETASSLAWLPNTPSSNTFEERCQSLANELRPLFTRLESSRPKLPVSDDLCWLCDNARFMLAELQDTANGLKPLRIVEHVRTLKGEVVPRVLAVAQAFLEATGYQFGEAELTSFVVTFQQTTVLQLRELRALAPALKLVLLERVANLGRQFLANRGSEPLGVGVCVRSLRDIGQGAWQDEVLEPLTVFDVILHRDPAGCYAKMDSDSRDLYRDKVSNIARYSDCTEVETAQAAIELAEEASRREYADPRVALRESHVGYYLLDEGAPALQRKVGFTPPFAQKLQALMRAFPNEFYVLGIELATFALIVAGMWLLEQPSSSFASLLVAMLVLLLPSSQSAVVVMNHLVTSVLTPQILPKLDFSDGVPDDCVTMVAVPCLLFNDQQVRNLVEDLEVRFLGNHDANIYFALLTDLPDTREPSCEDSPLITLCADLIQELNERYANRAMGSFFMFHRHRVYNPREKAWMGWERKRGKLLDLNKLLCGESDIFPVKVGDLSALPRVRFVITLDSDTELPRGTAQRMIGTLAHPLNQAIVDPETNVVVAGYGILQPRVGVSVQSTARSRLAAIYAGETGFDIYTRAVSDAYQDLYGEGIYTGKGIYEAAVLHRVLNRRFPRNALLSHDLIEGAYARAGLASDIEVIEDYPSHYSAYNRRKHRWLRGDWQIASWLFPRVFEESGEITRNPISLISQWKIFDNLRRSLVEPATFLLLVLGWLVLDRVPWHWTAVTLGILLVPACFQFVLGVVRSTWRRDSNVARDALTGFLTASVNFFFVLTFLAHQTLLSLDAVIRALVRRVVTHRRLLEWETAAEVEMGNRGQAPVDLYLNWMPALALGLGLLVLAVRPNALPAALPVLVLWGFSKAISSWLNQPPAPPRKQTPAEDVRFLRRSALQTWRYFAEFSTEEHHWLLPDNVQEEPHAVAARVSPTNLGLLLNARQAACELGYLTLPEFVTQTGRTLATLSGLQKYRGHMLNWYDTRTLRPLDPVFVSSVDSGNLLASLWTLQQGCLDRLRQPILQRCLLEGLLDQLRSLVSLRAFPRKLLAGLERQRKADNWLRLLLELPADALERAGLTIAKSKHAADGAWFAEQARMHLQNIHDMVRTYAPWSAPEFVALRGDISISLQMMDTIPLEQLPEFIDKLAAQLVSAASTASPEQQSLYERLAGQLPIARANVEFLIRELRMVSRQAGELADAMDFSFLLSRRRKLMSVGYEVTAEHLHAACYDLLCTESRTAIFAAIAKDDIPQETWFLLGRAHTLEGGRPVLLSWTGTMFEYLMPSLWMRTYPNTLLERARASSVRCQQAYARMKGVPWGISESAHSALDEAGNYQYHAFGLPHLALRKPAIDSLVISPYSTFLALNTDPAEALRNLKRMDYLGWCGKYGFYEAADYGSKRRKFWRPAPQVVRCWMAHHQGMSLIALANFLNDNVMQRWFHSERRVQATELLLHEKPVAHVRSRDIPYRLAAA